MRERSLSRRRLFGLVAGTVGVLGVVWVAGTVMRLHVPRPSGPHAVGRTRLAWVDRARPERHHPPNKREVIVEVWYPAKEHSGASCAYVPELGAISADLVQSGQLTSLEVWGLGRVGANERADAQFVEMSAPCPVVLFSPGNSTNVEFYAAYGEDLASHGFVVFGINHPYDVTGVRLRDNSVAVYAERPPDDREALAVRIDERVADVRFLVDRLQELDGDDGLFSHRLDLAHVGIMGHSLGGITAAVASAADARLVACVNVDGLMAGGPYAVRPDGKVPAQPFAYIGKERTISEKTARLVKDNPRGSLVVVQGVSHQDFIDSASFQPALNPFDGTARRALSEAGRATREFFEKQLR